MTSQFIRRVLLTAIAAPALVVGIARGQDRAEQPRSVPPQQAAAERQRADAAAAAQELAAMEAQMRQAQEQHRVLADELERTRAIVRQLEERLREARLHNAENEEVERAKAEHDAQRALLQEQETKYRDLLTELAGLDAAHSDLRNRLAAEQEQRKQATREKDLEAAQRRRAEAEQDATKIYRDVLSLAGQPDSTKALYEALAASEVQQLQVQYAGLQERLAQLEQLYQRGAVSQTELSDTKTQAATLLAQIRQATIRSMIEQVERERQGFDQRNDPVNVDVTGEVLQTEFFRGYLDTVQRYSELSRDPADAAVAAVVTAADLLRSQGPKASIEYFKPILEELSRASDPASSAAEAAVRMQLAEAYHAAGQDADALNVLRTLIVRGGAADKAPE